MLGFCSWIAFQSVAFAMAPKTTEGPVMIRAIRPPPYDNKTALADVLEDKTLNKEKIEFMSSEIFQTKFIPIFHSVVGDLILKIS